MTQSTDSPFLVLASKSPRRRYLLKQAGVAFTVVPSTGRSAYSFTLPASFHCYPTASNICGVSVLDWKGEFHKS